MTPSVRPSVRPSVPPSILLSFDIEEFDLPEEFHAAVPPERKNSVSRTGAFRILDLLDRHKDVRATFFTTGVFAENNPDFIQRIVRSGHETASHGYSHSHFAVSDLVKSKKILESLSGQEVTGFRMARLAPVGKSDIQSAGYTYESSLNPVWLPGRYNNFRKPLTPFREECGLLQVPVSALPVLRLPLFWLSFKNFPLPFYTACARLAAARTGFFSLYTHPWEYNEEAAEKSWNIPSYIVRHAGMPMISRLDAFLNAWHGRADFRTFRDYLKNF